MGHSGEDSLKGDKGIGRDISEERSSEATSKKTLKDIEETEKDSGSATDDQGSPPAPDGQFDENREIGNAGPM